MEGNLYRISYRTISTSPLTDKCIVLDLDETLLHSEEGYAMLGKDIMTNPKYLHLRKRFYRFSLFDVGEVKGTGNKIDMWGIKRPHVEEFLIFCFSYFKVVAVWSAGQPDYVESICAMLFQDILPPHIIYTFDHCEVGKDQYLMKPLTKLIKAEPHIGEYMNLQNTFALDDRITTFEGNPNNGIVIPPYHPAEGRSALTIALVESDDRSLMMLKDWLLRPEVMKCPDVKTLDKTKIFKAGNNTPTKL